MDMPTKTPPSLPFAASARPTNADSEVMGMVVDLQLGCFGGMHPDVTQDYLDQVAQALDTLRERNIPVMWLSMAEHSKLYLPSAASPPARRSIEELQDFEFHNIIHDNESRDVYMDFLAQHGPRTNEAVFCKYFFDAFTDMRGHPDARKLWDQHKTIRPEEYQQRFEEMNKILQGPPLIDFLREEGVKSIISFGGISTNCVLSTAIGAARHGIGSTICTDLLISLKDNDRVMPPSWYEDELQRKLEEKTTNAPLIEQLEFTTLSHSLYGLSVNGTPHNAPVSQRGKHSP